MFKLTKISLSFSVITDTFIQNENKFAQPNAEKYVITFKKESKALYCILCDENSKQEQFYHLQFGKIALNLYYIIVIWLND